MREIFSHPSSPFFKSAVAIDVGEMERGAFSDFIAKRFATGRRSADRDFLLGVVDDLAEIYNASSVKKALVRLETLGHVYRFRDEFYAIRTSLRPHRDGTETKDVPLYAFGARLAALLSESPA